MIHQVSTISLSNSLSSSEYSSFLIAASFRCAFSSSAQLHLLDLREPTLFIIQGTRRAAALVSYWKATTFRKKRLQMSMLRHNMITLGAVPKARRKVCCSRLFYVIRGLGHTPKYGVHTPKYGVSTPIRIGVWVARILYVGVRSFYVILFSVEIDVLVRMNLRKQPKRIRIFEYNHNRYYMSILEPQT